MSTSYSFSHYTAALQCLRKYKYIAIDRLEGDTSEHLLFGSSLHHGLHVALTQGAEHGEAGFVAHWLGQKDAMQSLKTRYNWDHYHNLGATFMDKFAGRYAPNMWFITGEQRLYGDYKGVKLEGTPDALVMYEGQPTLIDFKTTGYNYDKDKARISLQLYLYAHLLKQNGHEVTRIAYLPFVKGLGSIQKPVVANINDERKTELLDEMVEYLQKLNATQQFPRNPGNCIMGTNKCAFFETCWGKNE